MIVTLLYNRKTNFVWHFEMLGDAAFNARQGSIVYDKYVVVGTGEEAIMKACANIIDVFRNGKDWDNCYVIRKFNKVLKTINESRKNGKETKN